MSLDITVEEMDDILEDISQEIHSGNPVPMYLVDVHFTINQGDIYLNEEEGLAIGFEASHSNNIRICFFEVEEKEEQLYFREVSYRKIASSEKIQYKLNHLFKMARSSEQIVEERENKAYA